jgi:hypothetical protein
MLSIGDRVWLWGGYDNEPLWLQGVDGYSGRVDGFLSSDSQTQPCALIRLDSPMTLHDVNTSLLVGPGLIAAAAWLWALYLPPRSPWLIPIIVISFLCGFTALPSVVVAVTRLLRDQSTRLLPSIYLSAFAASRPAPHVKR